MSAEIITLPVVRVERFPNDDDHIAVDLEKSVTEQLASAAEQMGCSLEEAGAALIVWGLAAIARKPVVEFYRSLKAKTASP